MENKNQENWEKEFDKRFCEKIPYEDWVEPASLKTKISYIEKWKQKNPVKYIKSFIRQLLNERN